MILLEKAQMLDISILSADKYLNSLAKIKDFLNSTVEIEHKTDGVKVTIFKKDDTGTLKDYIVAYKGNILYPEEFEYQPEVKIKKESIGSSQFKLIFKHLEKIGKNNIPVGTELFIEYLMRKPTLSSDYNQKHKMVLIGYSKSRYEEKFGKLITYPVGFFTEKRDIYAKELKIDVPQLLFKGILGNVVSFGQGIISDILKKEFEKVKNSLNWDNPELLLNDIKNLFLEIESKYGGREEGVVIKYNGMLLKWQQEYQLDPIARAKIKAKYKENDPKLEDEYWKNVKRVALEISNAIPIKNLQDALKELAIYMKKLKLDFSHSKKTETMIKDDIQLSAKQLIIKNLKGNNNALVIGKFRIVTKDGHAKLFKRASSLFDNLVICIVSNKETIETKKLREKMVRAVAPNATIIHSTNGNLIRVLEKSPMNINVVYAGSDRVQSYREQLKNTLGVKVLELPRTSNDISASKVIENIHDKEFFLKNTPKEIHNMYDELLKVYG